MNQASQLLLRWNYFSGCILLVFGSPRHDLSIIEGSMQTEQKSIPLPESSLP